MIYELADVTLVTVTLNGGSRLERLRKTVPSDLTHLVIQQPTPPAGLLKGLNYAMGEVRTPLAMILHEDMALPHFPDEARRALHKMVARFTSSRVGAVAPRLTHGNGAQMIGPGPDLPIPAAMHEGLIVRLDVWRALGGLDAARFEFRTPDARWMSLYDDVDFGLRMMARGWETRLARDVELYHEGSTVLSTIDPQALTGYTQCGVYRLYRKHGGEALQKYLGWDVSQWEWMGREEIVQEWAQAKHLMEALHG